MSLFTPDISDPPIYDNAYVWLLMKGDAYLPGIITSVYSVLRTDPEADLVVMVTPDVTEKAIDIISKYATHIFYVPYLSFPTANMKTESQQKIYQNWYSDSYTKWNMLALPYKRAIFIDADIVCTTNSDSLFNLTAPAAPFNSPYAKPLGTIPNYTFKKNKKTYLKHNTPVHPYQVKNMLFKGGISFTATSVLLEPNLKHYDEYIEMVKSQPVYGKKFNCHSAPDERSLSEFYSIKKNKTWTNIHHQFNYIGWTKNFLKKSLIPVMIHYFSSTKPWSMKYNEYPDVISWYKMAGEALEYKNIKPEQILIKSADVKSAKQATDKYIKGFTKNKKIKSILDIQDYYTV
jgi:lipopolysaccharide biosynthesis glycosyltransferase